MVLDEGGEISERQSKEIGRPLAVIGIAEKGYASFELSVSKEGGHSSIPAKETAIDILTAALHKLRSNSPPARLTPPVREFLGRVGSSSDDFSHRLVASNMWLFEGATLSILSERQEGSALVRTTIVPTIVTAGVKDNVIPTIARAIVNTRIIPGETIRTVEEYIRATIRDDRVQIKETGRFSSEPSGVTSVGSAAFKRVESAVYKTIPSVLPAPYLMAGGTDSRYYRGIADGVVNFFPQTDGRGIHGINERLPILDLQRGIHFITTIIKESDKEFP
jgi:carboxypeptidase PM20D1